MIRVRAEEPGGQEAQDCSHVARDRPRRGDDERRLRADGHDRQGVRLDLRRLVRRHGRRRDRQGPRLQLRRRVGPGTADPRGDARKCARCRRGRDRHGLGSGLPDEAAAAGRRGDRHRWRAVLCVRDRDRARVRPLQPAQPRRGPLAQRRHRGGDRRGRRRRRGPGARRPDRRRGARPGAGVHDRRDRQVRRPQLDRRGDVRDLRRADRAGVARQGGQARRNLGRCGRGTTPERADSADPGRARR